MRSSFLLHNQRWEFKIPFHTIRVDSTVTKRLEIQIVLAGFSAQRSLPLCRLGNNLHPPLHVTASLSGLPLKWMREIRVNSPEGYRDG